MIWVMIHVLSGYGQGEGGFWMSTNTEKRMKKNILDSFMELLYKKSFSTITVNDICQQALIHRSSFYRYYEDKYQLLEQVINIMGEEVQQKVLESQGQYENISEVVIDYVEQHNTLVANVIRKGDVTNIIDKLSKLCGEMIYENAKNRNDPISLKVKNSNHPEVISELYGNMILVLIKKWINREGHINRQNLVDILDEIVQK